MSYIKLACIKALQQTKKDDANMKEVPSLLIAAIRDEDPLKEDCDRRRPSAADMSV
jgi:hypothetical protein